MDDPLSKIPARERQLIYGLANVYPRTLRNYFLGRSRAVTTERIEWALQRLNLPHLIRPPSDPDPRRSEVS